MNYSAGEITAVILFFIGVYGVIARRNIIKTVMSIGIMGNGSYSLFSGKRSIRCRAGRL